MKILAAFFGLIILISPVTVQAEVKYPEDFLMNSLGKITICVSSHRIGMNKLTSMVKQMQQEEPTNMAEDHKKIMLKMVDGINDIREIIRVERFLGTIIISRLMEDYDHTVEGLNTALKPFVEGTDNNMTELLKDITEFTEFNRVFVPKMNMCATTVENIGKEAENMQRQLETKK